MIERGFRESVVCVRDAGEVAAGFCALTGWVAGAAAASDQRLLRAWGLGPDCRGLELTLRQPDSPHGGIRLLQLDGVEQQPVRSNPQPWDTGGYLDLNIRVANMARCQREFGAAGWYAVSDPVQWRFGDKLVSEWLAIGPDGLALALIERLDPPLAPGDVPGGFGPAFNSSQVVADMPRSLAFYQEMLGMRKFLHIRQPLLPEPGENPLGIPHNLVSELEVEIAMLSPGGDINGSVELIAMHGLEGRDFAANARPPNLGIVALRFPVDDLDALAARLSGVGQALAMDPVEAVIAPLGTCRLFALQAPEGAWLEFYQLT